MTQRILGPTGSRRRRRFLVVPILLVAALGLFLLASAQGALPPNPGVESNGLFALDGNTLPTTCASPFPGLNAGDGDDWAALYTQATGGDTTPCGSDGFVFVADGIGKTGDTTYWQGGGSKDAYDPALGPWMFGTNDVSPDKNDIVNAFAAAYHSGTDKFLYFGSDRFNTNGDAQMGFWFLQAAVCLAGTTNPDGSLCPNTNPGKFVDPFTGVPIHHQNGDLLIIVNFNKGGTLGLAGIYEWENDTVPGTGVGSAVLVEFTDPSATPPTSADCLTITDPNDFCSTASTSDLTGDPVWSYTAKGGATSYSASSFMEGGVNLNRIPGAGKCFPTFIAETRSSAGPSTGLSLQAQLKDLAFGRFQLCAPQTSLTVSPSSTTVVTGSNVTLTFSEANTGNETLLNPRVVTDNATCGTLTTPTAGDTDGDGKLDVGETWQFQCTLTNIAAGTTTINAYGEGTGEDSGILVTGVQPCTPSATKVCSAAERTSATITALSPSTQLTKTASAAVTYTYLEANNGDVPLTNVAVTDDQCTPLARGTDSVGNNDNTLDAGEVWTFTCTRTLAGPTTDTGSATRTNTATGDATDATGRHITACTDPSSPPSNTLCKNERDAVTVTITNSARSGG